MKIGFFRALRGSCAGIAIFEELKNQTVLRAFWHLLLMAVLSAVIMSFGVYPALRGSVMGSVNAITDNCGTLTCTADGIFPVEPEKARTFLVAGPLAVTYLPENSKKLPEDFQMQCSSGIIWSGGKVGLWTLRKKDVYDFISLSDPLSAVQNQTVSGSAELLDALKKSPSIQFEMSENKIEKFTPERLKALVGVLLPLGTGVMLFRQTFLEVMLYIAMFTVVTLLMNIGRVRHLTLREMVVLAVYAGFPAMLIGSVAAALELPLLDFNIVYVFGMSIYLIIVMNSLERKRQERQWQHKE